MMPAGVPSFRLPLALNGALFACMAASTGMSASVEQASPGQLAGVEPFLREHCVKCHGRDGRIKGNVDLLGGLEKGTLAREPKVLEKVFQSVRDLQMPPEDAEQPAEKERSAFLARIETEWDRSIAQHAAPPRTPVRRMNRFQYNNAVTDLLDLRVDLFQLPERILRDHSGYFRPQTGVMPDQVNVGNRLMGKGQIIGPRMDGVLAFPQDLKAANGFDNRADLLSLSPLLMESFLDLSRSIVRSPDFNPKKVGAWNALFAEPGPNEDAGGVVRQRLEEFLQKAFRRPLEPEVLDRYVRHAQEAAREGGFVSGMKAAVSAALASPNFLYIHEGGTTGPRPVRVEDFELASRLSFFLWLSGPDEALAEAAREGRLNAPGEIGRQVDRMLNDPKMKRFCDAFAAQWMKIEYLQASEPDPRLFPIFRHFGAQSSTSRGSVHMMLEPLLIFETVLIENRSILDFIHSDFTYRSKQLQQFLDGEQKIERTKPGPNYSEVTIYERMPVCSMRDGGIITTSAVLTMTSAPAQTKPITRGKWLMETVYNDPPPPPPADVPELEKAPAKNADRALSLRERFAMHRERSDCASCHVKLDAFGFALENYDAVGRWRDQDEKQNPIDSSGTLFNRHVFQDIDGFKEALLSEKTRFARAFASHVLQYALGREIAPSDKPALDAIVSQTAGENFRIRDILKAVALSEPFALKFNPAEPVASAPPGTK
jgi:mono/diheme cytochrome c family protein